MRMPNETTQTKCFETLFVRHEWVWARQKISTPHQLTALIPENHSILFAIESLRVLMAGARSCKPSQRIWKWFSQCSWQERRETYAFNLAILSSFQCLPFLCRRSCFAERLGRVHECRNNKIQTLQESSNLAHARCEPGTTGDGSLLTASLHPNFASLNIT